MSKRKSAFVQGSLALACGAALFLAGCGSGEQQADHKALETLRQTDDSHIAGQDIDDLNRIQKTFDDLANNPDISKPMQVLVRSRQAQVRQERIAGMIADLRTQEVAINRDIEDIRRLAMQISGAQSSADSLKSYDPAPQIEKLKAQAAQITGSADQLTWTMSTSSGGSDSSVTLPTLFASKQEVEKLTHQISQDQTDSDAAHKLSAAKGDEAETYLRRAEGETGDDQVNDTTNSANDRRDAALADSKAAMLANDLDRCKSNLARATQQQSALEAALKLIDDQIQAHQTRWAAINDQMQAQQKVQQALIGDANSPSTIAGLLKDLTARLQDAADQREKVSAELSAVISQLHSVISNTQLLRNNWLMEARTNPDDPDAVVWKQASETLHPMNFGMQLASAMESKAAIDGEKIVIDMRLQNLRDGFKIPAAEAAAHFKSLNVPGSTGQIEIPGLADLLDPQKTGIDRPKSLGDLPSASPDDQLKFKQNVDQEFSDAVDSFDPTKFGATDSGAPADQRRNIALMNLAQANRVWAQFSTAMGDTTDARNELQAATDAEGQMDPSFALNTTPAPAAPAGSATPTPRAPAVP